MPIRDLLFEKERVASALGVSPSVLLRWLERGMLPSVSLTNGQQRFALSAVLKFLKSHEQFPEVPELLGLPATLRLTDRRIDDAVVELATALLDGNQELCRELVYEVYLRGGSVALICDDVITPALVEVSRLCRADRSRMPQSEVAAQTLDVLFDHLKDAWRSMDPWLPTAVGAPLQGEAGRVPLRMAKLVLREQGWSAYILGLDFESYDFSEAIRDRHPQLAWLSTAKTPSPETIANEIEPLRQEVAAHEGRLVLTGRGSIELAETPPEGVACCTTMRELESVSNEIRLNWVMGRAEAE